MGSGKMSGSITVFLALLFGVMAALFTVTIENVRIMTSDSYVTMSGEAAVLASFGDYNLELYEEYGLFGYGGYGQWKEEGLRKDVAQKIKDMVGNEDAVGNLFHQITVEDVVLKKTKNVSDDTIFYEKIQQYLVAHCVQNIVQKLMGNYNGILSQKKDTSLSDTLRDTKDYEKGVYKQDEADKKTETSQPDAGKESDGNKNTTASQEMSKETEEISKEKNPLETFREMMQGGLLYLVCENVPAAEESDALPETTAELLQTLLQGYKNISAITEVAAKKTTLLCYADAVFGSYVLDKGQSIRCGQEYIIAGKKDDKENLEEIVKRLLVIRTIANFVYVQQDQVLCSSSLATATAIAAAVALPALAKPLQQTILLIMAVEESCIDITALLQGRVVPFTKNQKNFQLKYSEICIAGKAFFARKAKKYPMQEKKIDFSKGVSYENYLLLFQMLISQQKLKERVCYLIETDLKKKYQSSFSLEHCVGGVTLEVSYKQNLLWKQFYGGNGFTPATQKVSLEYVYH